MDPLLAELEEWFARSGATSALVAKAGVKRTKELQTARRRLFTRGPTPELHRAGRW